MGKFVLRRLAQMLPVLLAVSLLAFALNCMGSGDTASLILRERGIEPTAEAVSQVRRELGLDRPLAVQYFSWLARAARFDFGRSFASELPVIEVIGEHFPATFVLALAATVFSLLLAVPLAVLAARFQDGWPDRAARALSVAGVTMPSFWLALMLLSLFAVRLGWVPVISGTRLKNIALPAVTIGFSYGCTYLGVLRQNLIEACAHPYMTAARARGLSRTGALLRHGLRNSLLPCVTLVGYNFGKLLSGHFAVETIFSWNGIGKFAVDSIQSKDLPVIQGYIVCVAAAYIVVNLLVDMLYFAIDPKLRLGAQKKV